MKNFALKIALTLLLGVGAALSASAQQIGGLVKDSAGEPIIGATVVVDGTLLGAMILIFTLLSCYFSL